MATTLLQSRVREDAREILNIANRSKRSMKLAQRDFSKMPSFVRKETLRIKKPRINKVKLKRALNINFDNVASQSRNKGGGNAGLLGLLGGAAGALGLGSLFGGGRGRGGINADGFRNNSGKALQTQRNAKGKFTLLEGGSYTDDIKQRYTQRYGERAARNRFGGGGLRKLGGISKSNAVLNTLFAGIEFAGRKGEGQTNLQATAGTAGSTLGGIGGFAAGAKGGAALGAGIGALFGGVGAIPGAAIGGLLGGIGGSIGGSMLGGKIADDITGVNRGEKYIGEDAPQVKLADPNRSVLDKFERLVEQYGRGGFGDGKSTVKSPSTTETPRTTQTTSTSFSGNPNSSTTAAMGSGIILNPSTTAAWNSAVQAAMDEAGIDLTKDVTSTFRTAEKQQELIDRAAAGDPNVFMPAPVGMSPHEQGWALDMSVGSPGQQWMIQNGPRFGFKWLGNKDPVHFEFHNNEPNDLYLRPGNRSWIPGDKEYEQRTSAVEPNNPNNNQQTASQSRSKQTTTRGSFRNNYVQNYDPNKKYKAGDYVKKDGKVMKHDGFGFAATDENAVTSQNLTPNAPKAEPPSVRPAPTVTPAPVPTTPATSVSQYTTYNRPGSNTTIIPITNTQMLPGPSSPSRVASSKKPQMPAGMNEREVLNKVYNKFLLTTLSAT